MRFPWSKREQDRTKPGTNTDGGRPTALFSFDRERERQMAERYSGERGAWVEARHSLIDEVLVYRRTGTLSQSLLDACEAEFAVAAWTRSEGVRRLVELAQDGHSIAAERLETLMSSRDWRFRYEALLTSFERISDQALRLKLARRGLTDRSARIRSQFAAGAVFAHLIDLAPEIEAAAKSEAVAKNAKALLRSAFYLRRNDRTGEKGRYGDDEQDRGIFEATWTDFQARHRSAPASI